MCYCQVECCCLLQILSLHNCTKLRSAALSAIAGGCPQLRMLMLGGCSLALTPTSDPTSGFAKVLLLSVTLLTMCMFFFPSDRSDGFV